MTPSQVAELKGPIRRLKADGARVILFVDPDPEIAARVASTGADGCEIYTGSYASAQRHGDASSYLTAIRNLGVKALAQGLVVNAGHDLNLRNLPGLLAAIPHLHEASIGHELTADALIMGFDTAVSAYAQALARAN